MTVPEWAYEYVTLYAERAREISIGASGREYQGPSSYSGITGSFLNGGLAIDTSMITYSEIWSQGGTEGNAVYSVWTSAVKTYTSLSIEVWAEWVTASTTRAESIVHLLEYSIDGGVNWITFGTSYHGPYPRPVYFIGLDDPLFPGHSVNNLKFSIGISAGTNLSLLQVRGRCSSTTGVNAGILIHDIKTLGYYMADEGSLVGLQVYSGPIFAAQNQDEIDGIAGLAIRGRYGDQVITKAIAYEDDVINGGYLPGTKAPFLAALASVTGNSSSSFAAFLSRIGRKPYYVGDSDSTYLAQTFVTGTSALYNARMSALIYADNFRKERVIQDHALGYGVEMGKHAAIDGETLRRAGLYQREYVQYGYTMSHKLFLEEQELAVVNLEIFGNCLRALTGSQQTTTADSPGGNKLTAAVGMGMATGVAGWYIGASIGWVGGPAGAAVGFAVGAIAGYLLS